MDKKYFKLLGCKILEREFASVTFDCKNVIDTTLIQMKLHETPKKLRCALQEEIDAIDANTHRYTNDTQGHDFDAILLGYGLCGEVTVGLSSQKYPLVIPRAHDCITLLMGKKETYQDFHEKNPGTFYYSPGYAEIMTLGDPDCQDADISPTCSAMPATNAKPKKPWIWKPPLWMATTTSPM